MAWGFTAVIHSADELTEELVREGAAASSWLTTAETDSHIPSAVAGAKALIGAEVGRFIVTLSGKPATDPKADSSHISVTVEVPPTSAAPVPSVAAPEGSTPVESIAVPAPTAEDVAAQVV